jgi:hypothetical protein
MAPPAAGPDPRLTLLLGTPRSGTTWLASILNSYKGALYSHEPLDRLRSPRLDELLTKVKRTGVLAEEERREILWEWIRGNADCRRPPFFAKSFLRSPAALRLAAWVLVRLSGVGEGPFRYLFSPRPGAAFDLVVKEVDWSGHVGSLLQALDPLLLVIMRHPCGVVASQLRGQTLGLMAGHDRFRWLEEHRQDCARLGFGPAEVRRMEPWEFLSLQWVVQNAAYLDAVKRNAPTHLVVYEELCRAPAVVTREVFDFLGWEVGRQTERFLRRSTASSSSWLSDRLQAKHPYFSVRKNSLQAAESWRTQLTPRQQEQVLAIALAFPSFHDYWGQPVPGPTAARPVGQRSG